MGDLLNYANQPIPAYINKDNTPNTNVITDEGATLGRVLFYDKLLSLTQTVSCASCHKQALAFGDTAVQSVGHDGGLTGRHSTRLSSARFGDEEKFFWDERANTLEDQTTMPIQDHIEMGFSGTDGDPGMDSLITRMENVSYYPELFHLAYGDPTVTEQRMQDALAQFVRSMQSFDSKYDVGRAQVGNNNAPFPNFTTSENNGKTLFMTPGAGCNRCHRAPEFDIDPNSRNNGIIGVAGSPGSIDLTNERSPSLRDIVNYNGEEIGPYMHDGSLETLEDVIDHYNAVPNLPINTNLDPRLIGPGGNLNLTTTEKADLLAFLKTLGGSNLYTDEKWSDPFDADGGLEILNGSLPVEIVYFEAYKNDGTVLLEWETLMEVNNEGFEILHSQNATDWEAIGFVEGLNTPSLYTFIHEEPTAGDNYYKLKQIDFDGLFDMTEYRIVHLEAEVSELVFYPNPTSDVVYIKGDSLPETVLVYGKNGRYIGEIEIGNQAIVDFSEFESGLYYIRVLHSNHSTYSVYKIVKM